MRKILYLNLAILFVTQLPAQTTFKRTTLYGEIAGNGIVLSVNYERQLSSKPGLGLHTGIGLGVNKPIIPLGAKYLFDLGDSKSFIETGLGITLAEREAWDDNFKGPDSYKAAFIPSVGYRHHTAYGLMWRVNYTPAFSRYRNILWLSGISVGWRL